MCKINLTPSTNPELFNVGNDDSEFNDIEFCDELADFFKPSSQFDETVEMLDAIYEENYGELDRFLNS